LAGTGYQSHLALEYAHYFHPVLGSTFGATLPS
jgi:hypothetical protein